MLTDDRRWTGRGARGSGVRGSRSSRGAGGVSTVGRHVPLREIASDPAPPRAAARAGRRSFFGILSGLAVVVIAARGAAEPAVDAPKGGDALFDVGSFGKRKEPITITSDSLEYDYKANVVVYHGDVLAVQGDTKVRSDTLTVTLVGSNNGGPPERAPDTGARSGQKVQEVVAVGNVRIDNGTRWATGGRAVFQQGTRTLVLTETPVLHDGPNEVNGDRVVVYLDQNRSVVEGGRKRAKSVLYPAKDGGLDPGAPAKDGTPPAAGPGAATP